MKNKPGKSSNPGAASQDDPKKSIPVNENTESDTDKENEEFPGYPHYPAKEDILNPKNGMHKIPAEDENLTRSGKFLNNKTGGPVAGADDVSRRIEDDDDLGIVPGTDADVTSDDLLILNDDGNATLPANLAEDLDIPGAELDDENEAIGEEDEENNYYSLGGDRHENLEEDQS